MSSKNLSFSLIDTPAENKTDSVTYESLIEKVNEQSSNIPEENHFSLEDLIHLNV